MELMNTYIIESFLEQIAAGVGIVIASAFLAICGAGIKFLVSKSRNENLQSSLDLYAQISAQVVSAIMQSQDVEQRKRNRQALKLTMKEGDALKEMARKQIEANLPDRTRDILKRANTDVDSLISVLIEGAVYRLKERGQ